jgi:hypothetical protein
MLPSDDQPDNLPDDQPSDEFVLPLQNYQDL